MTELVEYQPEPGAVSPQDEAIRRLGDWAKSASAAHSVAQRLVDSSFVPAGFRGKPVEATAAILAGIEVGLSPMAALRSFDIIQGQAAPRAITLRAIVQSQGHEMLLVESSDTRCVMKGRRKGDSEYQTVRWTLDRAKNLGLVSKENWRKQPGAMLVARATSELARLIASDAILGIAYSAEELGDGSAAETTDAAPEPSSVRRMSRRPVVVTELPQEAPDPDDPPCDADTDEQPALLPDPS